MEKKYEMIEESGLFRIVALKDFADVKKGSKGGLIERESNLSHEGNCWVYDNAVVWGYAQVSGNARVRNNARVHGQAQVYDRAVVFGKAEVFGNAQVYDDAQVFDNAKVYGVTIVEDKASVFGDAVVKEDAYIDGNASIRDVVITCREDYITFKNWWSTRRYFTWTRRNNMWSVGCFYGTGEELIKKAYQDSEKSGKEYERVVKYVESIMKGE